MLPVVVLPVVVDCVLVTEMDISSVITGGSVEVDKTESGLLYDAVVECNMVVDVSGTGYMKLDSRAVTKIASQPISQQIYLYCKLAVCRRLYQNSGT